MWQSSLKMLTDVGDKKSCEEQRDSDGERMGVYVSMR